MFTLTRFALAAALPLCSLSHAQNMLTNASFETVGPEGPSVVCTGIRGVGATAAENWWVFHNTLGKTKTELIPSTFPGPAGNLMLHVATDGAANGIEQVMLPENTGPACVVEGLWVYVISGVVYMGAGNGGNTGPNDYSTTTGQWEHLSANNAVCPANLFIVYASSPGGAEFYVELGSVTELSCAGPPGDLSADGTVDGADLGLLLGQWGACADCKADLNNDGQVDGADLGALLGNWGTCEPIS
jgi:hypothetical protein